MWRISLVLLICLAAVPAYSNPPSPAPAKNSENQKKHPATAEEKPAYNPTGTDKQPFVVKSLEAEKTPERTYQERPEREEKAANERSLIVWTMVLAGATIVLALLAGGQIWMFWVQLGLIRKSLIDTKGAADAAKQSADATERSVGIMQDTAERQLRAYIIVEEDGKFLETLTEDDRTTGVLIGLRMKNVGNTAAYKLKQWHCASVVRYPFTGEFLPSEFRRESIYIPPGYNERMEVKFRTHWTIEMLNMNAGGADTMGLYVWGEVRYVDAFNKPRFVKFRFVRQAQPNASINYCDEGNEAD